MQPLIEDLVKLQAVEVERTRLRKLLSAMPAEVAQAEAALKAAAKQQASIEAALASEEQKRTLFEQQTSLLRQKAERFRQQQDVVRTPTQAEAIEKELTFALAEIDRIEGEELESMGKTEELEVSRQTAIQAVQHQELVVERTRQRIAEQSNAAQDSLKLLVVERDAVRLKIEPELLAQFDRLAATRGTGLARAENQLCMGCRMCLRVPVWSKLRDGELLRCDSCGRLLYWDPAMRPAATSSAEQ